jgi:hypothetical protein
MTLVDEAEVRRKLELLVGKRLSRVKNAGDMKIFGFGEQLEVDAEHTKPEFGLHVHCPWRLEDKDAGRIVTGFSDFYVSAPDNEDKSWEPIDGKGSLQKYRMLELLHGPGSPLKTNSNTLGELTVTEAVLLPYYGLQIDLSPRYRLTVFPDGIADEQWRLLISGTPSTHYALENTSLYVE